ncbi:ATP-binding protein [Desulfonatronospira sp.]|uniref:sensor histidine kinase n=1 Tax=Desulfonatronospira sp. TaxID=1962951 RepID=UPI0025BE1506|nr:ATP-binding protein [Desulfonatronospira sp.]
MKVEIERDVKLSPEESVIMELHSFYNIINIISGELQILEMLAGENGDLKECVDLCFSIKRGMRNKSSVLEQSKAMEGNIHFIRNSLQEFFRKHPGLENEPDALESRTNLDSVMNILKVRADEIVTRLETPDRWEDHDLSRLLQNFLDVFTAIEKNSKGRYRFVYNLARQGPGDYFIHLNFESFQGERINMPPVFQDVMRDLVANARKYTDPGGKVLAGLYDDGKVIYFTVEDSGCGIPESELQRVVDFGFRGSNVREKRTMGGGFGLTKAYMMTRRYGGRMWVDSEEGHGTRITIYLPRAEA